MSDQLRRGAGPAGNLLVSVIIPTRDRPHRLRRAMTAVLEQEYEPIELIVVDDGSGPETHRVIHEAMAEDSRVRTLRHEISRGAGVARNAGAHAAEGPLLLFEDDDCVGRRSRIARLAAALGAAPDAAYAYSHSTISDQSDVRVHGREGAWAVGTPAALLRADRFHAVGGFDEELPRLQDFDLWTRLLARWPAVEVPEVLFETTRRPEDMSASDLRLLDAVELLREKYGPGSFSRRHASAMHRRLGGSLVVRGFWRRGLEEFGVAVRRCPWCSRCWLGLLAAAAGPPCYRALTRITRRR